MRRTLATALLLLSGLAVSSQALAQQKVAPIVGTYVLIQDDDGTTPRADAQVTLVFLPDGTAILSASLPGTPTISDKGGWSVTSDGKLSLVLPDSGKAVSQGKITISGRDLTLPFRVFSDDAGNSLWRRSSTLSLRAFAKDKEVIASPTTVISTPTPTPTPAVTPTNPTPTPTPTPTPAGPGKKPPQVIDPAAPATPVVADPSLPAPTPTPANPTPAPTNVPAYVGRYMGSAIGAEVRYRKEGVFTLTAKHLANFTFEINEKGEVKGSGQISYVLDSDRKGTGESAGEVENFPITYAPGTTLVKHEASLQGGTVIRDFELKGTFDPKTNTLTLLLTNDLGTLIYEYESQGKRATKDFPSWSPFPPDVPATLEIDAQGNASAAVDLMGKGRRDKWQEYRFMWNAKKVK